MSEEPKNDDTGDGSNGEAPKTFTQDQLNTFLADQKRKLQASFADYDDVKAKAAKFDEVEQANKTELQKLQEELAKTEERAAQAEQQALRADVARTKGVPASSLTGTTKEELEASADELLAWRDEGAKKSPPGPNGLRSGITPAGGAALNDKERAAAALRAMRAGN